MVKRVHLSVLAMSALVAFSEGAMARDFPDIYSQCGLGAMIAPKHEPVAIVTNITWDLGTTAVSSDMSSPNTCKGKRVKTAALIHQSYEQIASDLSRGHGKYLDSLLEISEVNADQKIAVKAQLREEFTNLVAQPGYSNLSRIDKSEALYELVFKGGKSNS